MGRILFLSFILSLLVGFDLFALGNKRIVLGDELNLSDIIQHYNREADVLYYFDSFRWGLYKKNNLAVYEDGVYINDAYTGKVIPRLAFFSFVDRINVVADEEDGLVYLLKSRDWADKDLHTEIVFGYGTLWDRDFSLRVTKRLEHLEFDLQTKLLKRYDTVPIMSEKGFYSDESLNAVKMKAGINTKFGRFLFGATSAKDDFAYDSMGSVSASVQLIRKGFFLSYKRKDKFSAQHSFNEYKIFSDTVVTKSYYRDVVVRYKLDRDLFFDYKLQSFKSNQAFARYSIINFGLLYKIERFALGLHNGLYDYSGEFIFKPDLCYEIPLNNGYIKAKYQRVAVAPTLEELNQKNTLKTETGDKIGLEFYTKKGRIEGSFAFDLINYKSFIFADGQDIWNGDVFLVNPRATFFLKSRWIDGFLKFNSVWPNKHHDYFVKLAGSLKGILKLPLKQFVSMSIYAATDSKYYPQYLSVDMVYTKRLFNAFFNIGIKNLYSSDKDRPKIYYVKAYVPFRN